QPPDHLAQPAEACSRRAHAAREPVAENHVMRYERCQSMGRKQLRVLLDVDRVLEWRIRIDRARAFEGKRERDGRRLRLWWRGRGHRIQGMGVSRHQRYQFQVTERERGKRRGRYPLPGHPPLTQGLIRDERPAVARLDDLPLQTRVEAASYPYALGE